MISKRAWEKHALVHFRGADKGFVGRKRCWHLLKITPVNKKLASLASQCGMALPIIIRDSFFYKHMMIFLWSLFRRKSQRQCTRSCRDDYSLLSHDLHEALNLLASGQGTKSTVQRDLGEVGRQLCWRTLSTTWFVVLYMEKVEGASLEFSSLDIPCRIDGVSMIGAVFKLLYFWRGGATPAFAQ